MAPPTQFGHGDASAERGRANVPEDQILNPADLPAEELIRLHLELEGDPATSAHREAWDRWNGWLADLRQTGQPDQTSRAARIGSYIDANFEPPSNAPRKAAALGVLTGGAGAAAFELEQAGQEAAAAGGGHVAHEAMAPAHASGEHGGEHLSKSGKRGGRAVRHASVRLARAAFTGPHRALAIFASSAVATAGVAIGAAAATGAFSGSSTTPQATGTTSSIPRPTTSLTVVAGTNFTCTGPQIKLFDNYNGGGVSGGGTAPTFTTGGKSYCLAQIDTYHWNGGQGSPPGSLRLGSSSGGVGPFTATASSGQGNAPNVNWYANIPTSTKPVMLDGTYTCQSSNASTWSQDSASGGAGFCEVLVVLAVPAGP